jgi:general stress protein 26
VTLDKRTKDFLESHEIAVLSSVDNKGNVQGATIYYALDAQNNFYFVTKSGTDKAQNILLNPQVALTIFDADTLQTAQIQGITQLEANPVIFEAITKNIFKLRKYGTDFGWPPLTKIISGQYVIFKIVPTSLKFSSYKD